MNKIGLVLLAGGEGLRFGSPTPKQFLPLKGIPVALHSLKLFDSREDIFEIVVVCAPCYRPVFADFNVRFALPGKERSDSLTSGIQALSDSINYVCIHDAVRPLLDSDTLSLLFEKGFETGAATLAEPLFYTIKKIHPESLTIIKTIDRNDVVKVHTPQFLKLSILKEGLRTAKERNISITDDVSCAELLGLPVSVVFSQSTNIKITTPQDLVLAEAITNL